MRRAVRSLLVVGPLGGVLAWACSLLATPGVIPSGQAHRAARSHISDGPSGGVQGGPGSADEATTRTAAVSEPDRQSPGLTFNGTPVRHTVLPKERLKDIALRYGVDKSEIIALNGLSEQHPRLRAGAQLEILAAIVPPERRKATHIVRFGDNWRTLAERYGVTQTQLRAWNPDVARRFAAGTALEVWTDRPDIPPLVSPLGIDLDATGLRLSATPEGSESRGSPSRGRLIAGAQLPANPDLYTVRRPEFAYGSSHTLKHLQLAIAKFRQTNQYDDELIVSDMSRRRGGRYAHHDSHQSGRDVDIWLPRSSEGAEGKPPASASQVHWPATWSLIKALVRTGQVQYIFLTRARQRKLYRTAREQGVDTQTLGAIIQYPRRAQTGIVRHAKGHNKHMHVRFHCGPYEDRCR